MSGCKNSEKGGNGGVSANGHGISLQDNKSALELDSGDDCPIKKNILKAHGLHTCRLKFPGSQDHMSGKKIRILK